MRPITLLLAEDHHLVREALRALLEEHDQFNVIGQAQDGSEALKLTEELHPDIVIMDITMPNLNGLEAAARMKEMKRPPRIIILSQYRRDEYIAQAIISGANGYLLKDSAANELPAAIKAVFNGETYLSNELPIETVEAALNRHTEIIAPLERLTPREREVLQLVAEGNTNRQIAFKLGISIKTVEKHRSSLMDKLVIRDTAGLVRFAIAHGIITTDAP